MNSNAQRRPTSSKYILVFEYGLVLLGSFFVALGFNLFLLPNNIASGGVAGISTILYDLFELEPSIVQWALNIPLFFLGVWLLGGMFVVKTLVVPLWVLFSVY